MVVVTWRLIGWAGTRRNIHFHPLTPNLIIKHPLSTSSTIHPCSIYVLFHNHSPGPLPKMPGRCLNFAAQIVHRVRTVLWFLSVLWRCWLGGRKGIWPVKNGVVGCWHGYLTGASVTSHNWFDAFSNLCVAMMTMRYFTRYTVYTQSVINQLRFLHHRTGTRPRSRRPTSAHNK